MSARACAYALAYAFSFALKSEISHHRAVRVFVCVCVRTRRFTVGAIFVFQSTPGYVRVLVK